MTTALPGDTAMADIVEASERTIVAIPARSCLVFVTS
jgi:hypothetical protein